MRWFFRVIVGLVGLILVAVVGLVLLPSDRIAQVLTDRFEAATGREMTITGGVRPSVWPTLGAHIGQVSIANADWTDGQPFVSAEAIEVGVDLAALFGGDIRIREVLLENPRIRLEKAANGQTNWTFAAPGASVADAPATAKSGIPAFSLDQGSIRGAEISYFDRGLGTATILSAADIDISGSRVCRANGDLADRTS